MLSPAQILASMDEEERAAYLADLTPEQKAKLRYNWEFWARPNQLPPPGDWTTWLILAGRGFGKTRMGAETIRSWVCGDTPLSPGHCSRIALVAETASDARDVMVEGESGLLACHPKDFRPTYYPSKRLVEWPNGARALMFNATEPDQLRGPQHDGAWCDEAAKWQYATETWDQLQFGLRLGEHPRQLVTTTPRPIPLIRRLIADEATVVTRGSTRDNRDNLATPFLKQVEEKYKGTRLGRQELDGEILEDIPGAFWNREIIDGNRCKEDDMPDLQRIIVAVDPAATSGEDADETGIVVVGIAPNADGVMQGYVLADRSVKGTPEEWGRRAVQAYREFSADRIVAEKNNGGEMVEHVMKSVDRSVPITLVHASRGKVVRAEPISALYEQGRVKHVGIFDKLEDQMCRFSADMNRNEESPDRVDALVWGLTSVFDKITGRRRRPIKEEAVVRSEYQRGSVLDDVPTGWMGG